MKSIALFAAGIAGMFVGAVTMEVVHRVRPDFVKEITASTKKTFGLIGQAFWKGYYGQTEGEPRLDGANVSEEGQR